MIGQKLATGVQAALIPRVVNNDADAESAFGRGSMLATMAAAFRQQAPLAELWAVALDDAAGAVSTTRTVTVSSAATGGGNDCAVYLRPENLGTDCRGDVGGTGRGGDQHGDRAFH